MSKKGGVTVCNESNVKSAEFTRKRADEELARVDQHTDLVLERLFIGCTHEEIS